MYNCSHIIVMTIRSFQEKVTIKRRKIWRNWSIKAAWAHHTQLSIFYFPAQKDMLQVFLEENYQECKKNRLSCVQAERRSMPSRKSSVHYRLGLSISSIAARSFCLAFLLICDPRQTFTRLVNCFVEYSCPKRENPNVTPNALELMLLINTTEQADIWGWRMAERCGPARVLEGTAEA